MDSDPGPAPWDLPPKPTVKPGPRSRGPATSKPLPLAARTAMAQKRANLAGNAALIECLGCAELVLDVAGDGLLDGDVLSPVKLDIWQVPYDDAVIINRYHLEMLYRELRPGKVSGWAPWNRCGALIEHQCGNRWWQYRPSMYVEEVYARRGN